MPIPFILPPRSSSPMTWRAYRRVQEGLRATGSEWVSQHSRFDPDVDDASPQSALSEQYICNQYRAWLACMCRET